MEVSFFSVGSVGMTANGGSRCAPSYYPVERDPAESTPDRVFVEIFFLSDGGWSLTRPGTGPGHWTAEVSVG
ncbi:hypothetical protein ACFM35_06505 [Microbacterium sp. P01]|uniref:hypothetical protein n=1 Tax=Microbacterium sp. P01 TaxID=3366261 RepID=UPI003670C34D